VRGPNLMKGYHNKPAETASAPRKGWYHGAVIERGFSGQSWLTYRQALGRVPQPLTAVVAMPA
jgi:long-chain acyl-CoA synthetase